MALIVVISSIVQGLLQMPAGYIADKIGNRKAVVFGSFIAAPSPLFYAWMPDFWGGLIASLLFYGGSAFISGAVEAFIHDTLVVLGRAREYTKVMGRAQTQGLIGNAILIVLVPLTYQIHHTIPFILGFVSLLIVLWLAIQLRDVPQHDKRPPRRPVQAFRSVVTLDNIALFIFAGWLAGVANKGIEYRELLFQDIGIETVWFGVIMAASSILGAVMGWYIHMFDRLKAMTFYAIDAAVLAGSLVCMGVTNVPIVAAVAVIVFMAYGRVRPIMFQSYMLRELKHTYKATLLSALNLFTLLGDVVVITLLTRCVNSGGYLVGHIWFGLAVGGIGCLLWFVMLGVSCRGRAQQIQEEVI